MNVAPVMPTQSEQGFDIIGPTPTTKTLTVPTAGAGWKNQLENHTGRDQKEQIQKANRIHDEVHRCPSHLCIPNEHLRTDHLHEPVILACTRSAVKLASLGHRRRLRFISVDGLAR